MSGAGTEPWKCSNCSRPLAPTALGAQGGRCEPCRTAALQPRLVLRPGSVVMVRRALAMYARFYLDLGQRSKEEWEKLECKQYVAAADSLSMQLLKGK